MDQHRPIRPLPTIATFLVSLDILLFLLAASMTHINTKEGKTKAYPRVPWVACRARSTPCSKMVGSGDGGGSSGRGRGRGRRQIIVLLCAACAYISIADRSSLSVLIIDMKDELGWSAREEATIMSSFYYGTS